MHADQTPEPNTLSWESIIDALATRGWAEQRDFLPASLTGELYTEMHREWENGKLQKAGIGRGSDHQIIDAIRGDYIGWLEPQPASPAQNTFLGLMNRFRQMVNRQLLLGLEDYEVMAAYYPAGTRYGKHLDRFKGTSERTLTTVLYLNPHWEQSHGGELRIYTDGERYVDILPRAGTLATFITEGVWHEVLPATRARLSLTGWFRRRAIGGTII